jgi:hypothetical protein
MPAAAIAKMAPILASQIFSASRTSFCLENHPILNHDSPAKKSGGLLGIVLRATGESMAPATIETLRRSGWA